MAADQGRRSERFSLKGASIHTWTIVAAVALVLALGGLIGWTFFGVTRTAAALEESEYAKLANEVRTRLDRLGNRDRTRLMEAGFSSALYDLVAHGAAQPDSFIRPPFAEWFPRQFGDKFVAIYSLDGRALYRWNDSSMGGVEQAVVKNGLLRMLDNREPIAGVVRTDVGLIHVAGAAILPSNYADSSQAIRGYVIVAQPLPAGALGPGVGDRPGRLSIAPLTAAREPQKVEVRSFAGGDSVDVQFALSDIYAQQAMLASLKTGRGEFLSAGRHFRTLLITALLGVILIVGGLWLVARRYLVLPFRRFRQVIQPLASGNLPGPMPSLGPSEEWTVLSQGVNRVVSLARVQQERFERAFAMARDGLWEWDVTAAEWNLSPSLTRLLGYAEGQLEATRAGFEDLTHPDDRIRLASSLDQAASAGDPIREDIRFRRRDSTYLWCRVQANTTLNHLGRPKSVNGSVTDIAPERAAVAAREQMVAQGAMQREDQGRFLIGLGLQLQATINVAGTDPARGLARLAVQAGQIRDIGSIDVGDLAVAALPFDIHQLLQEVTAKAGEAAGAPIELTVVPGLPSLVVGDPSRLRQLIDALLGYGTGRGMSLGVDRAAGSDQRLRLAVEIPGAVTAARQDRIHRQIDGELPEEGGLEIAVAGRLARALGGGLTVDFGSARAMFFTAELPLPAVKEEFAPAVMDSGPEPGPATWESPGSAISFTEEAYTFGQPAQPPVELVADSTVQIRFDGESVSGVSPEQPAVNPRLLEELTQARNGSGSGLAPQMVAIFLHDAPVRISEIRGAVHDAEPGTVNGLAQNLKSICLILGAAPLAELCRELEESTEGEAFTHASAIVERIEREFGRVRAALEPPPSSEPSTTPIDLPAIEPAMLEQLRASAGDEFGLAGQLVSLFLAEAPYQLEGIEAAVGEQDPKQAHEIAKELSGMCSMVGAAQMVEQCAALRSLGAGQSEEARKLTELLRREYGRVAAVLEGLIPVKVTR
ncbi:MAG: Hpt domain-containing protein [Gemmatimonadota bacterium]